MEILTDAGSLQQRTNDLRLAGKTIGFVPTMGALHAGHLSLVETARQHSDVVIVSIFVNPLQFGPHDDLSRYPRNLTHDIELLTNAGTDYVFAPSPAELYPPDFDTSVTVAQADQLLEGAVRPGHFRGVATVLTILFNLVRPDRVWMGQKDAQQVFVVKKMVADLRLPLEIMVAPTMREADGLAMSSRNQYLNETEREAAPVLFRALSRAQELYENGEREGAKIVEAMQEILVAEPLAKVEYLSINEAATLAPLKSLKGVSALISMAVRIGSTRLIDNLILP